jgi:hypothetical protein
MCTLVRACFICEHSAGNGRLVCSCLQCHRFCRWQEAEARALLKTKQQATAAKIAAAALDAAAGPVEPPKPTVTFVTGNKKKLEEVRVSHSSLSPAALARGARSRGTLTALLQVVAVLSQGKPLPFTLVNKALDLPEYQVSD